MTLGRRYELVLEKIIQKQIQVQGLTATDQQYLSLYVWVGSR